MRCRNCNSENIQEKIRMGLASEQATFGLKYKKSLFVAVAPTFCDLCLDCGEVNRIYIDKSTDKKWVVK